MPGQGGNGGAESACGTRSHFEADRNGISMQIRKERNMKSRVGLFVLAGAVLAGQVFGQTTGNSSGDDLSGRGTAQHLTKFIGSHTVGNSGIVESGGNIT